VPARLCSRFGFELSLFLGATEQESSGANVGRLQRKKTSKKKKKPETSNGSPATTVQPTVVRPAAGPAAGNKKTIVSKKPAGVVKPVATKPKENLISTSIQFLREVKVELKKVAWPTRKQTLGSTLVVIILVTIIAFFLGAVDIGLSSLVKLILR
jgi:preprotein translocase subunit SecE